MGAAAYRAREKLYDERTGETWNHSRDSADVLFKGIYAPKGSPEWMKDRGQLWNAIEKAERQHNSQVAREFTIALMNQMNAEQNRYALQDWVKENFTRKGFVADVSIHRPDPEGDQRNIHAHVMVTMRPIDGNGFSTRKERSPDRKADLEQWRESWERIGNRHLERHGFEPVLDRRTLAAQGIDREPTFHLGKDTAELERRGIQTERGDQLRAIRERNAEREQDRQREKEQQPQPKALAAYISDRRRQFLEQQHVAWNAMEQQGRDMLGRHSQARTGLQQLQDEANIQQHAQSGFLSFFSFVSSAFGLGKRTPIKKIGREELQRRDKQRDDRKELEHAQEQERKQWEGRRSSLLEQQAQARDLFERQLREQSPLQRAFDSGRDDSQPARSEDSAFSRMAARREAQRERDRDGPGLER